ncbi:hypothetical protein TIFTF001_028297 [Ficus carica]|uniref:Uncharacterized protein n=1 Tax=Ficus carica TaxID=3494 RepID=A0AA88DPP6_FICCA|nr:hypothetical protein TIFTF001_028297 [Ficus carica]
MERETFREDGIATEIVTEGDVITTGHDLDGADDPSPMVHIPWLLWLPRVGRAVSSGFLTSSRRLFRLSGVGTSGDGKRQSLDIGIVLGIWNPLSMRSASLGMETAVTEGDSDAILAVSRSTIDKLLLAHSLFLLNFRSNGRVPSYSDAEFRLTLTPSSLVRSTSEPVALSLPPPPQIHTGAGGTLPPPQIRTGAEGTLPPSPPQIYSGTKSLLPLSPHRFTPESEVLSFPPPTPQIHAGAGGPLPSSIGDLGSTPLLPRSGFGPSSSDPVIWVLGPNHLAQSGFCTPHHCRQCDLGLAPHLRFGFLMKRETEGGER